MHDFAHWWLDGVNGLIIGCSIGFVCGFVLGFRGLIVFAALYIPFMFVLWKSL